jgi:hypothetical protein
MRPLAYELDRTAENLIYLVWLWFKIPRDELAAPPMLTFEPPYWSFCESVPDRAPYGGQYYQGVSGFSPSSEI